jgi:hypothetical protein
MDRRLPVFIAVVLIVSVALRFAVALYLGNAFDEVRGGTCDQISYDALAQRVANGAGFTFQRHWWPYARADQPTAFWSYLYTAFVAGIYAVVGVHPLAARLVQAILGGVLLPWMIYRLAACTNLTQGRKGAKMLGQEEASLTQGRKERRESGQGDRGRGVALLAARVTPVCGYFILNAAQAVTETIYVVGLLQSLERALALTERPGVTRGAARRTTTMSSAGSGPPCTD